MNTGEKIIILNKDKPLRVTCKFAWVPKKKKLNWYSIIYEYNIAFNKYKGLKEKKLIKETYYTGSGEKILG
jgi:hypothetical protein